MKFALSVLIGWLAGLAIATLAVAISSPGIVPAGIVGMAFGAAGVFAGSAFARKRGW